MTAVTDSPKPARKRRKPNPWVKRFRSPIHNNGLFAAKTIPEGPRVIEYVGEKITKKESYRRAVERIDRAQRTGGAAVFIFELNSKHDVDGNVRWNPARMINHSCEPNCETKIIMGHIWIVALREIEPGEELSYDYGYDIEHWEEHPCRCGHPDCVGYIVRRDQRKKLKRLLKKRKEHSGAKSGNR